MTRHKTEPPGIRAIISKYDIKDAKDLDERLGIYQALADHDYTAIDKPAYEAMMEDIERLKRKAKVCDVFLGIAYEHFAWNDMKCEIKLTDEVIKIDPEDHEAIFQERLDYMLKRKEGKR